MELILEKLSIDKVVLAPGVEQCASVSFDFVTIDLEDNFDCPSEVLMIQRLLVNY